jgi:mRNA-degrading endonuclease RelE of RelBE toxin-antitoxin system
MNFSIRFNDAWEMSWSEAIDGFREFVDVRLQPGCHKLVGSDSSYRIRICYYRVVYPIENTVFIVEVEQVATERTFTDKFDHLPDDSITSRLEGR